MAVKKDALEVFIKEELEKEAEQIRMENEAEKEPMPEEIKTEIKRKLDEQIEELEWKRKYPGLSEEELRALRIGQEVLDKEKAGNGETEDPKAKGARRRAGRFRFYGGMAAVLALVFTVGMTSLGGAERVVEFMKSMVADREVMKANSSDENLVIVDQSEEEAYQLVRDEFGIEPVKLVIGCLDEMYFESMKLDKEFQLAELSYIYNGENIIFYINASYKEGSLGMDVEDRIKEEYSIEVSNCLIKIREHEIKDTGEGRYSAIFKYKGLEYFLTGTMKREEFEIILKNMHFIS